MLASSCQNGKPPPLQISRYVVPLLYMVYIQYAMVILHTGSHEHRTCKTFLVATSTTTLCTNTPVVCPIIRSKRIQSRNHSNIRGPLRCRLEYPPVLLQEQEADDNDILDLLRACIHDELRFGPHGWFVSVGVGHATTLVEEGNGLLSVGSMELRDIEGKDNIPLLDLKHGYEPRATCRQRNLSICMTSWNHPQTKCRFDGEKGCVNRMRSVRGRTMLTG